MLNFCKNRLSYEHRKTLSQWIKALPGGKQLMYYYTEWHAHRNAAAYLVSFPKSGRTWLRLLIGHVLTKHYNLEHVPTEALVDITRLAELQHGVPKIIVTHGGSPFMKTPEELIPPAKKYKGKRVILLIRDPRDTVVSSYYERKKRSNVYHTAPYQGTLWDFLNEQAGSFQTILRYLELWNDQHDACEAFLLVRYEDLHSNPERELGRVCAFLELQNVTPETISYAVDQCAFHRMRTLEEQEKVASERLTPGDKDDKESYKTRKGKVGGYREELSDREIAGLTEQIKERLPDSYGYNRL